MYFIGSHLNAFPGVTFVRDYPIYGPIVFGAVILLGWWRARDAAARTGAALWLAASVGAAFAAGEFFVAPRARPSLHGVQPGVSVLYHAVSGYPPPSGVAAMAGAVTAGLFLLHGRLGIAAAVVAAAMATFQICVIAYAWQDVLAGFVFGIAIAGGGYAVLAGALTRPPARIGGGHARLGAGGQPGERASQAGGRAGGRAEQAGGQMGGCAERAGGRVGQSRSLSPGRAPAGVTPAAHGAGRPSACSGRPPGQA